MFTFRTMTMRSPFWTSIRQASLSPSTSWRKATIPSGTVALRDLAPVLAMLIVDNRSYDVDIGNTWETITTCRILGLPTERHICALYGAVDTFLY